MSVNLFTSFINGEFRALSKGKLSRFTKLLNANTGAVFGEAAIADKAEVDLAVRAAQNAFQDGSEWKSWGGRERRNALLSIAEAVHSEKRVLADMEAVSGKVITEALMDVDACVDVLRFYAGFADKLSGRTFQNDTNFHSYTIMEPIGVCGLITSFNYPLLIATWKLAPAIACGNTVVLKPCHQNPLSSLHFASIASKFFPPGVFNVVLGEHETGSYLTTHPLVQKISFTGSSKSGAHVAEAQANHPRGPQKPTLELGGKNAIVIFDDADLELAVRNVVEGAFSNAGQNCCACSRVFVQKRIYDRFLELLRNSVSSLQVGDSSLETSQVGPLVDGNALERVLNFVQKGNAEGSILFCGGKQVEETGFFIQPTVFINVADDSSLAQEEIFGPILSVMEPFEERSEVVSRVNHSRYGLAAGVFSSSSVNIQYCVSKIHAGFIWVNNYNDVPPHLPLGGLKSSGYGKEVGLEAIAEFCNTKSVHFQFGSN